MTKQEKIREGMRGIQLGDRDGDRVLVVSDEAIDGILNYLHSQGVVIKVERELPYKWHEFTREHSYRPYREYTTHVLSNKFDEMFGYVQKYQCMGEANDLYEKPERFVIYLGNHEWAYSTKSFPTLRKAKENLLEQFLSSRDNPDNEIPAGYVAVEPLIGEG